MAENNELFADVKIDIDTSSVVSNFEQLNEVLTKTQANLEAFKQKGFAKDSPEVKQFVQSVINEFNRGVEAATDMGAAIKDSVKDIAKTDADTAFVDGLIRKLKTLQDEEATTAQKMRVVRSLLRDIEQLDKQFGGLKIDYKMFDELASSIALAFESKAPKSFGDILNYVVKQTITATATTKQLIKTEEDLAKAREKVSNAGNKKTIKHDDVKSNAEKAKEAVEALGETSSVAAKKVNELLTGDNGLAAKQSKRDAIVERLNNQKEALSDIANYAYADYMRLKGVKEGDLNLKNFEDLIKQIDELDTTQGTIEKITNDILEKFDLKAKIGGEPLIEQFDVLKPSGEGMESNEIKAYFKEQIEGILALRRQAAALNRDIATIKPLGNIDVSATMSKGYTQVFSFIEKLDKFQNSENGRMPAKSLFASLQSTLAEQELVHKSIGGTGVDEELDNLQKLMRSVTDMASKAYAFKGADKKGFISALLTGGTGNVTMSKEAMEQLAIVQTHLGNFQELQNNVKSNSQGIDIKKPFEEAKEGAEDADNALNGFVEKLYNSIFDDKINGETPPDKIGKDAEAATPKVENLGDKLNKLNSGGKTPADDDIQHLGEEADKTAPKIDNLKDKMDHLGDNADMSKPAEQMGETVEVTKDRLSQLEHVLHNYENSVQQGIGGYKENLANELKTIFQDLQVIPDLPVEEKLQVYSALFEDQASKLKKNGIGGEIFEQFAKDAQDTIPKLLGVKDAVETVDKSKFDALDNEFHESVKKCEELIKTVSELQSQLKDVVPKSEFDSIKKQLDESTESITRMKSEMEKASSEIERLQQENAPLKIDNDKYIKDLQDNREEIEARGDQIYDLKKKYEEQIEANRVLNDQLQKTNSLYDEQTKKVEELETKLSQTGNAKTNTEELANILSEMAKISSVNTSGLDGMANNITAIMNAIGGAENKPTIIDTMVAAALRLEEVLDNVSQSIVNAISKIGTISNNVSEETKQNVENAVQIVSSASEVINSVDQKTEQAAEKAKKRTEDLIATAKKNVLRYNGKGEIVGQTTSGFGEDGERISANADKDGNVRSYTVEIETELQQLENLAKTYQKAAANYLKAVGTGNKQMISDTLAAFEEAGKQFENFISDIDQEQVGYKEVIDNVNQTLSDMDTKLESAAEKALTNRITAASKTLLAAKEKFNEAIRSDDETLFTNASNALTVAENNWNALLNTTRNASEEQSRIIGDTQRKMAELNRKGDIASEKNAITQLKAVSNEYIAAKRDYMSAVRNGDEKSIQITLQAMQAAQTKFNEMANTLRGTSTEADKLISKTETRSQILDNQAGLSKQKEVEAQLKTAAQEYIKATSDWVAAIKTGNAEMAAKARESVDEKGKEYGETVKNIQEKSATVISIIQNTNKELSALRDKKTNYEQDNNIASMQSAADAYIKAARDYLAALKTGDEKLIAKSETAMKDAGNEFMKKATSIKTAGKDITDTIRGTIREIESLNGSISRTKGDNALGSYETAIAEYKKARRDLQAAEKSGDGSNIAKMKEEVRAALELVNARKQAAQQLGLTEKQQEKQNSLVREQERAERENLNALNAMQMAAKGSEAVFERIYRWAVNMLVLNQLRKIWSDALQYVIKYYDSLNSIRVVTGASADEAQRLGNEYRNIAEELKVSSLTISDAMEKIYRQGYDNKEDVAGIQKWTTIFGAITGTDTASALETMTAALQNFRKDGETTTELAQRIADSWSYLGDAVATSASDVGTAMGKVAGSAANVGVGLEQVSSWAALIMAKTQESAESVGNSLNSIITRYTKLTEKGYNSIIEDEEGEAVAFNDVAKALKQAGIEMYNSEEGFVDFGVVIDQIGEKWGSMSDALQKYIAFQMAGTRNMNRFITLMDNYAQSTELTRQALLSEGTAMQKYGIWTESVTAAQNDLQNSLESLYATLLDGETVKGFYGLMTGFVDNINQAIESTGKLNLAIPGIIAGVMTMFGAFQKLQKLGTGADGLFSLGTLFTGMSGSIGGVIAAAGAIFAVITAVVQIYDHFNTTVQESIENTSKLSASLVDGGKALDGVKKKWDAFNDIADDSEHAAEKSLALDAVIQDITNKAPNLARQFNLASDSIDEMGTRADRTAKALEELAKKEAAANWVAANSGIDDAIVSYTNANHIMNGASNIIQTKENKISYYPTLSPEEQIKDDVFFILSQEAETLAAAREKQKILEGYIGIFQETFGEDSDELKALRDEIGILYNEIDQMEDGAKQQLEESARVILTEALNPSTFKGLSLGNIQQIIDSVLQMDISNMSAGELQNMARKMAEMWSSGLEDAFNEASKLSNRAVTEGLSDELYAEIQRAANDLKDRFPDIDFGLEQQLTAWDGQKNQFALDFGKHRLDFLEDQGMLNSDVLSAISSGLKNMNAKDRAGFWGRLYAIDELPKTGSQMINLVNSIFNDLGYQVSSDVKAVDGIWKKGLEQVIDSAEKYANLKLSNSNYSNIFERMIGADGNGKISIGTAIYDYAKEALGAYGAQQEDIQKYAEQVMKNIISDNGWLAYLLDSNGELVADIENVDDLIDRMGADHVFDGMSVDAEHLKQMIHEMGEEGETTAGILGLMMNLFRKDNVGDLAAGNKKTAERNTESRTNYRGTVTGLNNIFETEGADAALKAYNALDKEIRTGLNTAYPELTAALAEVEDGTKDASEASEGLKEVLGDIMDRSDTSFFKDTEKALKGITDGTTDGKDALKSYWEEIDKLREVATAISNLESKDVSLLSVDDGDLKKVADYFGIPAEALKNNWNTELIHGMLDGATTEAEGYFYRLKDAIAKIYGDDMPPLLQGMLDMIAGFFIDGGIKVKDGTDNIGTLMKSAIDTNKKNMEQYSSNRLGKENYGSIFKDMMGGSNIADAAYKAAEEELRGITDNTAEITSYAQQIISNMLGQNGWMGYLMDENMNMMTEVEDMDGLLNTMDDNGVFEAMGVDAEYLRDKIAEANTPLEQMLILWQTLMGLSNGNDLQTMALGNQNQAELNTESRNGYSGTLTQLSNAFDAGGLQAFMDVWNQLDPAIQKGINSTYPDLVKEMARADAEMKNSAKTAKSLDNATDRLGKALKKTVDRSTTKYFKDTEAAMKGVENGTKSAADMATDYYKEVEKLKEAQTAADKVMQKGFKGASAEAKTLATYLGISEEELSGWDASQISAAMAQAVNESTSYLSMLQDAAFIELMLTGYSDVDFSQARGEIIQVEGLTEDMLAVLQACGGFETQELETEAQVSVWTVTSTDPLTGATDGHWEKKTAPAKTSVLVPKQGNPLSTGGKTGGGKTGGGKSGGGGNKGGGGGGGGSTKVSKEVTNLEKEQTAVKKLHDNYLELLSAKKAYYAETGNIKTQQVLVIEEIAETKRYNKMIEEQIAAINDLIAKREAVMAKYKPNSSKYKKAAADVEALRDDLHALNKKFIENASSIESMNKTLRELSKSMHQAVVAVEDMIRETITKEVEHGKSMLTATKNIEDEVLGIIRARYEKQRDMENDATQASIDAAEKRKDALQKEIDALDEALNKRKELSEQADKEAELAKLEEQYRRISADPTRGREALEIQKKIGDMRKEIAWDAAEAEVEAQKKVLQDQYDAEDKKIESLQKQMEAISKRYEAILDDPKALMDEMLEIMKMSNDEILEWMKQNSEDYANSSETSRKIMEQGWQDTLNAMVGYQETYAKQVSELMGKTDEEIIEWLKQHNQDFKNATDAQREVLIADWKETLQTWKQATSETAKDIVDIIDKMRNDALLSNPSYKVTVDPINTTIPKFASGGLVDFTGLAWLDGTKSNPEYVLNNEQLNKMQKLISSMQGVIRMNVPFMSAVTSAMFAKSSTTESLNIENIHINVDSLADDADYEMIAEKVGEAIQRSINRGRSVGGITMS